MKLYGFPPSPNTWKVRAFAHQIGVPLELEMVDLTKGAQKTRYLALNRPPHADPGRRRPRALGVERHPAIPGHQDENAAVARRRQNAGRHHALAELAPAALEPRHERLHLREPRQADLADGTTRSEGAGAGGRAVPSGCHRARQAPVRPSLSGQRHADACRLHGGRAPVSRRAWQDPAREVRQHQALVPARRRRCRLGSRPHPSASRSRADRAKPSGGGAGPALLFIGRFDGRLRATQSLRPHEGAITLTSRSPMASQQRPPRRHP
jgi:hypothetical protein